MKAIIALIPARSGSQRIPGKNIKSLAGHPLLAYTIAAAKQSGVFSRVLVSSDSTEILDIGCRYGADWIARPARFATAESPDIEWVQHALSQPEITADCFAILRPTSPFRTAATIRRAWGLFERGDADSLRAVEPWRGPHPGKMWTYSNAEVRLYPVLKEWTAHAPYHSSPTQSLVPVVTQNASLEMAHTRVIHAVIPTIAGDDIMPFWTEGCEGFDLNTMDDWARAEQKIASGEWTLQAV